MVTRLWPPTRTPTLSSWGSGQVCGPMPGPVRVCPPRSRVMPSATTTRPSPGQLRSFARVRLSETRIAHALPTHGGTMRTPIMAAIARSCAARGWYALRFNFRGVGASAGEWSGGRDEVDDLSAAVRSARTIGPALPLGLVGYSFGAFQVLEYLRRGGAADAVALVGVGIKDVNFEPRRMPDVPPGTFIRAA